MKQRVVHFAGTSETILPALQFTEAEKGLLWFSKGELGAIRMLGGNKLSELQAAASRKRCRYINYVLYLQRINRENGLEDPTGLGALAIAQSKCAAESARFRAEKNAADVVADAYNNAVTSRTGDSSAACLQRVSEVQEGESKEEGQSCSCSRQRSGRRSPLQSPRRNRTAANMA